MIVRSKAPGPILMFPAHFADNILPGPSAAFHGGAIGTGFTVQLEFWAIGGTRRMAALAGA